MVHYRPTEQYRAHFDFLGDGEAEGEAGGGGDGRGHRLVTVFVYLQLPKAGGRTAFPALGQSFQPAVGGALVWYNLDRDGRPDRLTLHAGEPVEANQP